MPLTQIILKNKWKWKKNAKLLQEKLVILKKEQQPSLKKENQTLKGNK